MAVFEVKSSDCFVCGTNKDITAHHGIPQVLKPRNNVIVPVCRHCHDKINEVDFGAVSSYLYKIQKTLEEKTSAIYGLQKVIDKYHNQATEKKRE